VAFGLKISLKHDLEPNKNGEYSFVKEFEKEGTYHLKYHVGKGEQFFEETTTLLVGSEADTEENHDHTEETSSDTHDHETTNETQEGEQAEGEITTHLMYDSKEKNFLFMCQKVVHT
jgi:ABC-type Zn2+ transport system substrate-binding protein/surface adhesin